MYACNINHMHTEDGGAVCSEEVLDSQNVCFLPKFSQSGSKGDQDHSNEQQPPKVCGKYSRTDCGNVSQQHTCSHDDNQLLNCKKILYNY